MLSFHLGFGCIMAPGPYPVQRAESELGLKTLGPPWPPPDLTPDQWVAGLGRLPLLDQPGTRWRYNTGASVVGVLIEWVAGAPLAEVLRERVFDPLGMADTGFWVPPAKRDRFTTFNAPSGQAGGQDGSPAGGHGGGPAGEHADGHAGGPGGALRVLDRPDGWWAAPLRFPDASGALVSTADDLWAFASMLAADGGGLLAAESVRLMTRDRMTAGERAENRIFVGDHRGWGLMMLVPPDGPAGTPEAPAIPGGFGWDGSSGTTWRTDRRTGLTGILLTQRMATSPEPTQLVRDFWAAAYAAIGPLTAGRAVLPPGGQPG